MSIILNSKLKNVEDLYQYDEEYRDTIATVDEQGKRIWIYPKKPKGKYHRYRIAFSIILLTLLFAGPFIKIGNQPLLLVNIFERKFVIFGQVFWPQDFFLLALTLVTFFVFVILFTVVFGRLWCGWACPQTLFMEMVFRKIEYWIEGDATKQRKLNKSYWNNDKIFKKGLKHLIFIIISIFISHTVMAYIIGIDQVIQIVSQPPTAHLAGFIGLLFFTGIFYWVFAFFREQACVTVCPYGRLQGVLLVKDSIVVAYDWLRGEPRGKLKRNQKEANPKGDCIDCKLCVHVCPTGIDIRNGTQLECVNCTACMDACDEVMLKVNRPQGLIRYASYNSIKDNISKILNPRVAAYSAVLLGLIIILSAFIVTRSEVAVTVLKVPGQLYNRTEDGYITNLYNIQFVNKTFENQSLVLKIGEGISASIEQVGATNIHIAPSDIYKGVFFIKIPADKIQKAKTVVPIEIYKNGEKIATEKTKFLGPISKRIEN